ncbi:hypothetical protein KI688_007307 [Linnemannia hyalina]|uniref:Uncharacterized protein n=1 Tax=Linnemannia hyalina TaxID=64524 RepID=A0A9P8BM64_9FUNG|nr:hypothetical protein KI688_007307 [Linnemannia hyalina]
MGHDGDMSSGKKARESSQPAPKSLSGSDPNISTESHANLNKTDLERISTTVVVPEPLRKVAAGLVTNAKLDVFVNTFAELTDAIAEKMQIKACET